MWGVDVLNGKMTEKGCGRSAYGLAYRLHGGRSLMLHNS